MDILTVEDDGYRKTDDPVILDHASELFKGYILKGSGLLARGYTSAGEQ